MRRFDETWHLLLEWTLGQTPSERMAALILDEEGFESIDPSHPLGGKDGGADALIQKDGQPWVMAVYFPRGQQSIKDITDKLTSDIDTARKKNPVGVAFVTNQELRLAEREELGKAGGDITVDLYHLERVTTVLDRPHMAPVREQFLGIPAGPPPILVTAEAIGMARCFTRDDELLDMLVAQEETSLRDRAEELRSAPPDPLRYRHTVAPLLCTMGYQASDEPPEPMSDDEINERVAAFRAGLERRWDACQEYLASIAWPALRFRVTNHAKSFLTNVQVILTFHGAAGIGFADPNFAWERLKDPSWQPPAFGPYGAGVVIPPMARALPADYPVDWDHNDDGDLEVTITLPELRPHPPWRHKGDDVVLAVRDIDLPEITVTYTVTAHGHGTVFEGEPFTVPVERVDIFDAAKFALDASCDD